MGQKAASFFVGITGRAARQVKHAGLAEHARIEKLEKGPKLAQVIFHGSAAERQTMIAAQEARHPRAGLAPSHIVGQPTAEREAIEKLHPAQTFALVIAQTSNKTGWLRGGFNTLKLAQLLAHAGEGRVAAGLGFRSQQRVEQ